MEHGLLSEEKYQKTKSKIAIVAVIVYPILLKLNLNFEVNRKIFGRVR